MIEVTCAIIRNDEGKVLVVRRGPGMGNAGKWEFPGGKIKRGESQEDCIVREIQEELGIDIILSGSLEPVEHDYGDKYIKLYPFICDTLATSLFLTEHDDHKWLVPDHLTDVNLSEADVPVAQDYASKFSANTEEEYSEAKQINCVGEAIEELSGVLNRVTHAREVDMIAHQAASDPSVLSMLLSLSMSTDRHIGFKASWPISKVADINPEAMTPYLCTIIDALPSIDNESVQRAFMRVIDKSDIKNIPVSHHGKLADYCFTSVRSGTTAVAPKAYAMDILSKMCDIYPDMKGEVISTINIILNDATAGIKAQAIKATSRLLKNDVR